MDLHEKAARLPTAPGVYLFKNAAGQIVYVGKAKDLRSRVRSYFLAGRWEDAKTGTLVREAAELDAVVVDTEAEALALENSLIKRWQPRYNVLLRDDKTYPYIRLTRETWPRIYVTRRIVNDGSENFGPYFPAGFAYRLAHFVHKYFLVPSCRVDLERTHPRPCLQYHIHRCLGPCVAGLTTPERYAQAVRDVRLLLGGRQAELAGELARRRDAAAAEERFEEAASWRDLISVLEEMRHRQKMHAVGGEDADIVGLYREDDRVALNVFHMRHGRVVDRREFFWDALPAEASAAEPDAGRDERLGAILKQIYLGQPFVPPLILLPADFEDREALQEALSRQCEGNVEIAIPRRGAKKAMLELVQTNARHSFARHFRTDRPADEGAAQAASLAVALALPAPPARVECFDVSHFQGAETVASMVVWEPGGMRRSEYRKFKIRGVTGVDDFRSIAEAVGRRYRRRLEEGALLPDVILIDGGIGQLHAAREALRGLGVSLAGGTPGDEAPVVWEGTLAAIAKREEIVCIAGRESAPIRLDPHSRALHVIQSIRDEAHRFAVGFHRQRRGKNTLRSSLLEVPGVGPATVRELLRRFGSLAAVRTADRATLAAVVGAARAAAIAAHFEAGNAAVGAASEEK